MLNRGLESDDLEPSHVGAYENLGGTLFAVLLDFMCAKGGRQGLSSGEVRNGPGKVRVACGSCLA